VAGAAISTHRNRPQIPTKPYLTGLLLGFTSQAAFLSLCFDWRCLTSLGDLWGLCGLQNYRTKRVWCMSLLRQRSSLLQVWTASVVASSALSLAKGVILFQHSTAAFAGPPSAFAAQQKSRRGMNTYSPDSNPQKAAPRRRIHMESDAKKPTSPTKIPKKRLFIAVEVLSKRKHLQFPFLSLLVFF
jgi:hypothetical protein